MIVPISRKSEYLYLTRVVLKFKLLYKLFLRRSIMILFFLLEVVQNIPQNFEI